MEKKWHEEEGWGGSHPTPNPQPPAGPGGKPLDNTFPQGGGANVSALHNFPGWNNAGAPLNPPPKPKGV